MNANYKTILYANLETRACGVKIHKDINQFIGGVAQGYALCLQNKEESPITLNIGPLSGVFPFASKTACVYFAQNNEVRESFGGGGLALIMKMAGLDGVVITGKSKELLGLVVTNSEAQLVNIGKASQKSVFKNEGLSGKRSLVEFSQKTMIDTYFSFGDEDLAVKAKSRGLGGIIISGSQSFPIYNKSYYERIYFNIIANPAKLETQFMGYKSCGGCPAGCRYSKTGEAKQRAVLPRCLVSCQFAVNIYKNVPLVFSCLESLGYHYNHDDLEQIAEKLGKIKSELG